MSNVTNGREYWLTSGTSHHLAPMQEIQTPDDDDPARPWRFEGCVTGLANMPNYVWSRPVALESTEKSDLTETLWRERIQGELAGVLLDSLSKERRSTDDFRASVAGLARRLWEERAALSREVHQLRGECEVLRERTGASVLPLYMDDGSSITCEEISGGGDEYQGMPRQLTLRHDQPDAEAKTARYVQQGAENLGAMLHQVMQLFSTTAHGIELLPLADGTVVLEVGDDSDTVFKIEGVPVAEALRAVLDRGWK